MIIVEKVEKFKITPLWKFDIIRSLYWLIAYRFSYRWSTLWNKKIESTVICTESKFGLCDRLRGFVSIYSLCKKYHLPFKIHHFGTLTLNQFIEPNSYDWFIGKEELKAPDLSFEYLDFETVASGCSAENFFMNRFLKKRLKNAHTNQILVSSNAFLVKDGKIFSHLFNELFRPTQLVQEQLNYYKEIIGGGVDYISVSSRFAGLIGDFNEDFNKVLPENERTNLLNNCIVQIEKLHQKYPDKKILVCSDSITLLNMAKKLEYVVVIEGKPVHVNNSTDSNVETHLKTFVDFFMIAGAEKVFLLVGGKMYPSGFPRIAALSQNKPFEIIKF